MFYVPQDLKIKTIPAKVCLSGDSKLTLQSGRGIFFGSICEPVKAVQIYFEAVLEKGRVIRTNASRKFRVIGIGLYYMCYSIL